jgi:hypothetical protein
VKWNVRILRWSSEVKCKNLTPMNCLSLHLAPQYIDRPEISDFSLNGSWSNLLQRKKSIWLAIYTNSPNLNKCSITLQHCIQCSDNMTGSAQNRYMWTSHSPCAGNEGIQWEITYICLRSHISAEIMYICKLSRISARDHVYPQEITHICRRSRISARDRVHLQRSRISAWDRVYLREIAYICGISRISGGDHVYLREITYICRGSRISARDHVYLQDITYICKRSRISAGDRIYLQQITYICTHYYL